MKKRRRESESVYQPKHFHYLPFHKRGRRKRRRRKEGRRKKEKMKKMDLLSLLTFYSLQEEVRRKKRWKVDGELTTFSLA
jgi:hypothetical protein